MRGNNGRQTDLQCRTLLFQDKYIVDSVGNLCGNGLMVKGDVGITGNVIMKEDLLIKGDLVVQGTITPSGGGGSVSRCVYPGAPDTNFGNQNVYPTCQYGLSTARPLAGNYSESQGMTLDSNGNIIPCGYSLYGATLWRLTPEGLLDNTFGTNGFTSYQDFTNSNADNEFTGVEMQLDGKIVAAGYSFFSSVFHGIFCRFNSDGSLDFANVITTNNTSFEDCVVDPVSQQLYVCGGENFGNGVIYRYNTDGTLDTTFNSPNGYLTFGGNTFDGIELQSDGKIVAINGNGRQVVRFNTDGTLDTTFNSPNGFVDFNPFVVGTNVQLYDFTLQPADDKILLIDNTYHTEVYRLNADGSWDTTFNQGVTSITAPSNNSNFLGTISVGSTVGFPPTGGVVLINFATVGFRLGTYDSITPTTLLGCTMNVFPLLTTGDAVYVIPGLNDSDSLDASSVAVAPDGKVVLAGYCFGSDYSLYYSRILTNGLRDTTFGPYGEGITFNFVPNAIYDNEVYKCLVQPDGKIITAGYIYDSVTGNELMAVSRVLGDAIMPLALPKKIPQRRLPQPQIQRRVEENKKKTRPQQQLEERKKKILTTKDRINVKMINTRQHLKRLRAFDLEMKKAL